jgi:ribosomal subunit interface protein
VGGADPREATEEIVNTEVPIVIFGRDVDAPHPYRSHIAEKLARLERYDMHVIRYEVELEHEQDPCQSKTCQHVAISARTERRTIGADARGPNFHAALDAAVSKMDERLRRTHNRQRVRHDRHQWPATDSAVYA